MYKILKIVDVENGINENSFEISDDYFFSIDIDKYYVIVDEEDNIVGVVPEDFNMFFRVGSDMGSFEDIDVENLIRLIENGESFELLGVDIANEKVKIIKVKPGYRLIEVNNTISIPFTNYPFELDGLIVFKNFKSLEETIKYTYEI
jgi:hypothetical protein